MQKEKLQERLQFYKDHLFFDLVPFWLKNGIDEENGGFYTCFNIEGTQLLSKDKYIWSQGRLVWIFSKLAEIDIPEISSDERKVYIGLAKQGVDFLLDNCILDNGNFAFLVDEKGKFKEVGSGYDISTFADCFVALGLSCYSRVALDEKILDKALEIYNRVVYKYDNDMFKIAPYLIPKDMKPHSIPMILLNLSYELSESLKIMGRQKEYVEVEKDNTLFLAEILNNFKEENGLILETVSKENKPVDSFLGRYVNPGHSLEDAWFIIQSAKRNNDDISIGKACEITMKTFEVGWDDVYGGLYYYVDKEGGMPKGRYLSEIERIQGTQILDNWDDKLWWPHSEALYTTLLCYIITKDKKFLDLYEMTHEYIFKTFPNPDNSVGEWIQLRDRKGLPQTSEVGGRLPVKDPFHIIRDMILIIELLKEQI